jgi:RNA polymerase subunit RPABC4/transcription elongation factor Spt4
MERKPAAKCPNCSAEMQSYGWQQLLILLRGTFPLERTLPLEVLVCPGCGKMDFYALDDTRKVLGSGKAKPEIRLCHVCKHEVIVNEKCPFCGAMPKDERTPMI